MKKDWTIKRSLLFWGHVYDKFNHLSPVINLLRLEYERVYGVK